MKNLLILLMSIIAVSVTASASVQKEVVPVELGAKSFSDGDVIQIIKVLSSSERLEQGDVVTVRGKYRLDSVESANLFLLLTQTKSDGKAEIDKLQKVKAKRGWHQFEATVTVKHQGFLHLTFYDNETGAPFGGVYFGTPSQMANAKGISVEHYQDNR